MKLNKDLAIAIQAAENEDNRLPSPPSMDLSGTNTWVNSCPRCHAPATPDPWRCTVCAWVAGADPDGCCTAIHDVIDDPDGDAHYPVTTSEITAAKSKPDKDRSRKEKLIKNLNHGDPDKVKKAE
jgi:hypothetical protein